MFDLTEIAKAALMLVASIITYVVIPYIKARTTAEQQDNLNFWVRIAVRAAEQVYTGSGRGQEKKMFVLNWLEDHDITFDCEAVDAMIEAAVYELNKGAF